MATKKEAEPFQLVDGLLHAYATNNRINIYLIENLADEAWMLKAPGGKGRDAASIIAHMHNVRLLWLKAMGVAEADLPAKLDGAFRSRSLKRRKPWRRVAGLLKRHFERPLKATAGSKASNRTQQVSSRI